jgi:hypothetical protein
MLDLRTRTLTLAIAAGFSIAECTTALADATTDVSIATASSCANGSALYVIHNASTASSVLATVKQVITVAGKSDSSTLQIFLAAGETKRLGCAVQDPPPAKHVQFSWQVQAAQYQ